MKKIIIILSLLCLLAFGQVYAGIKYKIKRKSVTTNTALLLPAKTYVYGMALYASSVNATMSIYDSATLGNATSPIDEIGEANQYQSVDFPWPDPIYFENGVTVIITNGVGFVSYGSTS